MHLFAALVGVAGITAAYVAWLGVTDHTTVAVSYLLVVLFVAAASPLWVAIVTSLVAMLAFNFFFLPPVGALMISDPQNWLALFAFLVVSLVASRLSSTARNRQREAWSRRDELARLFDLGRDILLTTEPGPEAVASLARHISRRFDLEYVAICLPAGAEFRRFEAGALDLGHLLTTEDLRRTSADAERVMAAEAEAAAGRQVVVSDATHPVRLVPLRLGTRAVGVLATSGRAIEPDTLDTLGSLVAIAIERIHFLEERRQAELAQRSAEFKSALLGLTRPRPADAVDHDSCGCRQSAGVVVDRCRP